LKVQLDGEREARQRLELRLTSQLLRQRLVASVSAALCASSWLAAGGLYFGALRPAAERALATAEQSLLGERRMSSETRERELQAISRSDELSARVTGLERDLRAERERRAAPPSAPGNVRKWTTREPLSAKSVVKPCRDDGDPMNPCLRR
jgi:hypothetical protein